MRFAYKVPVTFISVYSVCWKVFVCVFLTLFVIARKPLDDLTERTGYSQLKEGALDRTMWRAPFGKCFGPVESQNTK